MSIGKLVFKIFNKILKIIKILFLLSLIMLFVVFLSNYLIEKNAINKTFSEVSEIPKNKIGLVLGTSKFLRSGRVNQYFTYRINATIDLYENGKIAFILVSGDNGNSYYDEPTDFKEELIKQGIPSDKIFLDYAGFRTLDSAVRAKEIFGLTSITFISQKFHNERAIYLAENNGIKSIGFNAKDVSKKYGFRTQIREYFARTKAFIDILFHVKPKYLGKKIEIK